MNKALFLLIFLIAIVSLPGCGYNHCIKLGGGYNGVEGEIEWCYSPVKSQAEGRPILENEEGEKLVGLTETDVSTVLDMVGDKLGEKAKDLMGKIGIKSIPPPEAKEQSPVRELVRRIEEHRRK